MCLRYRFYISWHFKYVCLNSTEVSAGYRLGHVHELQCFRYEETTVFHSTMDTMFTQPIFEQWKLQFNSLKAYAFNPVEILTVWPANGLS